MPGTVIAMQALSRRAALLSGFALLLLPYAASAGELLSGKLVVTGSSTVAPLVLEIAKAFEKLHPAVRIDVQTGGSSRGIADVRSGLADIGMASRALGTNEGDLFGHAIARDGVCIIVHKSNPVTQLSDAQIIAMFTGANADWMDVGGKPLRITIVNKAEGRSTLELFLAHFKLKNSQIKPSVVIGDNAQGIKTVAGNPGAIGYVSIGSAEFEAGQGTAIKLLPMSGIAPSIDSVRSGKFPLSRPLNLVTRANPEGLAKSFIDFARSKDVHGLVTEQFFVPIEG